jgi:hypothetical protein
MNFNISDARALPLKSPAMSAIFRLTSKRIGHRTGQETHRPQGKSETESTQPARARESLACPAFP